MGGIGIKIIKLQRWTQEALEIKKNTNNILKVNAFPGNGV
jgi:hypothetical protein